MRLAVLVAADRFAGIGVLVMVLENELAEAARAIGRGFEDRCRSRFAEAQKIAGTEVNPFNFKSRFILGSPG